MKFFNWKYALGEILIVIIGITIAFSMNKCADNSRQKSERIQYLTNLQNDIEADKQQLELNLTALSNKIASCDTIIPQLGIESNQKMAIVSHIFKVAQVSNFSSKDITYHTLINSGDLKLINDFDLKTAIEAHYSGYDVMMKDYERQETIHKEYLGPYFIQHSDYSLMREGVFPFDDEKLLKNIIQSMRGSFQIKYNATEKGIASCDKLLTTLAEALK